MQNKVSKNIPEETNSDSDLEILNPKNYETQKKKNRNWRYVHYNDEDDDDEVEEMEISQETEEEMSNNNLEEMEEEEEGNVLYMFNFFFNFFYFSKKTEHTNYHKKIIIQIDTFITIRKNKYPQRSRTFYGLRRDLLGRNNRIDLTDRNVVNSYCNMYNFYTQVTIDKLKM